MNIIVILCIAQFSRTFLQESLAKIWAAQQLTYKSYQQGRTD